MSAKLTEGHTFERLAGFPVSMPFRRAQCHRSFSTHSADSSAPRGSQSLPVARIAVSFVHLAPTVGLSAVHAMFGFPPRTLFMSRPSWCSTTLRRMVTARQIVSLLRRSIVPIRTRQLFESGCADFQHGGSSICRSSANMRCSERLRAVTAAAPTACAPSHFSAAAAPALRRR